MFNALLKLFVFNERFRESPKFGSHIFARSENKKPRWYFMHAWRQPSSHRSFKFQFRSENES